VINQAKNHTHFWSFCDGSDTFNWYSHWFHILSKKEETLWQHKLQKQLKFHQS